MQLTYTNTMNKYKFRVSFRLEKRTDKTGNVATENVPILADVTFDKKRFFFYTGYRINADQWIDKIVDGVRIQQVKRNNVKKDTGENFAEINARLNRIRTALDSVFKRLEVNDIEPTVDVVRKELRIEMGEDVSTTKNLKECYKKFIEEQGKADNWSKGTTTKHKTIFSHLLEYKPSVDFADINEEFFAGFVNFLTDTKKHRNTYIAKNIHDLKWFLNWATKRGYNKSRAYMAYSPRLKGTKASDKNNIITLTVDEFLHLYNLDIPSESLQRVRDVFCFCCATGLRYSDARNLKWSDVKDDSIDFVTIKTDEHLKVDLNEFSKGILAKYERNKGVVPYVLPVISNQKYNEHLKDLGKLAGFDEEITKVYFKGAERIETTYKKYELMTTHIARKTFVTLSLAAGIPAEVVRSYTGHKDAKVMDRYVYFQDPTKADAMKKFHFDNQVNETIFDHQITDEERQILGIPEKEDYIRIAKADSGLATLHLAFLFHLRDDSVKSLEYVSKLPDQMKVQYIQTITSGLKK